MASRGEDILKGDSIEEEYQVQKLRKRKNEYIYFAKFWEIYFQNGIYCACSKNSKNVGQIPKFQLVLNSQLVDMLQKGEYYILLK